MFEWHWCVLFFPKPLHRTEPHALLCATHMINRLRFGRNDRHPEAIETLSAVDLTVVLFRIKGCSNSFTSDESEYLGSVGNKRRAQKSPSCAGNRLIDACIHVDVNIQTITKKKK